MSGSNRQSQPLLLVFGYPSKPPKVGGLVWSKRVSDYIYSKDTTIKLTNVSNGRSIEKKLNNGGPLIKNILSCLIEDAHDAFTGFSKLPEVVLLDSWGEANIMLWILLRTFRRKTKIVTIFHHYEPRISATHIANRSRYERKLATWYNSAIDKITGSMIKNSDRVLTISNASASSLCSYYGLDRSAKKVTIVGAGIDIFQVDKNIEKDIDFLCIGRIEKMDGLEKIWQAIRHLCPNTRLVMIGRASKEEIARLQAVGIEHRGVVSETEKILLYSRSKVFVFPSSMEGYGIALAEALYSGLHAIVWNLPVFAEIYGNTSYASDRKIRLVNCKEYETFAKESVDALKESMQEKEFFYSTSSTGTQGDQLMSSLVEKRSTTRQNDNIKIASWDDVGKRVLSVINELLTGKP